MAKDLVRIRKHQEKFVNLTAQLRAISLQMTVRSTHELSRHADRAVSHGSIALQPSA